MRIPYDSGEDSVSLEALGEIGGIPRQEDCAKSEPRLRVANVKLLISLFLIFVVVVSDVFTDSVISGFGEKAVRGRSLTSWGVALQGIFLVIFYILAVYLTENHIL
jgi:hypothetical protein